MKILIRLLVVVAMIFAFTGAAYAGTPLEKLGRGVANVITCPIELVAGIVDTSNESGPMAGCTIGVLKGTFNIVRRAVVGVYEVVSFPVPVPEDYAPIITDPEYFFASETNILGKQQAI